MKTYDVAINWNSKDDCYFAKKVQSACREIGLSFLWIHDDNSKDVLRKLQTGALRIKVLIDTDATYEDPRDIFARICYAVKDSEGAVINDPDRTKYAIDKSCMYYDVKKAGIDTPYTYIVRKWDPKTFKLPDHQRERLGVPFVIKPALGYAQKGVVKSATGSPYSIAKARRFDLNDDFLLQEKVEPLVFGGKRAWFRVFHVMDSVIPCWWDDTVSVYEHVSEEDFSRYSLRGLAEITVKLSRITGMIWFSTEIALVQGPSGGASRRFMLIDYVNDQCDMTPGSEIPTGVPDHIVDYTASRLMRAVHDNLRPANGNMSYEYSIYLNPLTHVSYPASVIPPDLFNGHLSDI